MTVNFEKYLDETLLLPDPSTAVKVDESAGAHLPQNMALLIIDVQSYYCDPSHDSKFGCENTDRVAGLIASIAPEFRKAGVAIYAIHLSRENTNDPDRIDFYKFKPDVAAGDVVFRKTDASAFKEADLGYMLRKNGIKHVFAAGVFLDLCVAATVKDALKERFNVEVLSDLTCQYSRPLFGHETWALDDLRQSGAKISTSGEALSRLAKAQP